MNSLEKLPKNIGSSMSNSIEDLPELGVSLKIQIGTLSNSTKNIGLLRTTSFLFECDTVNSLFGRSFFTHSYDVYISHLVNNDCVCNRVLDCNESNLCMTGKLLNQGFCNHTLILTFSKFFHRYKTWLSLLI